MVFTVYIKSSQTMLGAFMMQEDAEMFKRNSMLEELLEIKQIEAWDHFRAIREAIAES